MSRSNIWYSLVGVAFGLWPLPILLGAELPDVVSFPASNNPTIVDALASEPREMVFDRAVIDDVAMQRSHDKPTVRPYIGAIVGASFATLTDVGPLSSQIGNEPLFTAGGTLGLSFDRPFGAMRIEVEGRGRDQMISSADLAGVGNLSIRATDNWSTLVNGWVDLNLSERFAIYGGGGIGGGGYRTVVNGSALGFDITGAQAGGAFAWQAGGGVFYNITDRFAIDLGYRFFSIDPLAGSGEVTTPTPIPLSFNTGFAASELLLTLRFYEPFRRWR